jgi:phosphohistidine phosphatase
MRPKVLRPEVKTDKTVGFRSDRRQLIDSIIVKLLLIRHAEAEAQPPLLGRFAGNKDAARRLTAEGKKQMRQVARGLRAIVAGVDVMATSPYVRARETADIVAEIFDCDNPVEVPALASGATPERLAAWLDDQPHDATIVLVGHQPDLSAIAGWFLNGVTVSVLDFEKGAACLIEFDGAAARGRGRLCWHLPPDVSSRVG